MTDLFFGTSGPRNASIAIVGEAWGEQEAAKLRPFIGSAGEEFRLLLKESHIDPNECFMTNLVSQRPSGNNMWTLFYPAKGAPLPPVRGLHPTEAVVRGMQTLHKQLEQVRPKVILAAGNYALWALTNCTGFSTTAESFGRRAPNGIMNWRGSQWYPDALNSEALQDTKLIPIIHPSAIRRDWKQRAPTKHDLQTRVPMALKGRWRPNPTPIFLSPPSFEMACARFDMWIRKMDSGVKLRIVNDIETSRQLMTCIGFADSTHFAMCIPFIQLDGKVFKSYWSEHEERVLCMLIRKLLTHPNILLEGQNYRYDLQYISSYLGCRPRVDFDTMFAQRTLFPGTPSALHYLSSLYCDHHWFWKDDGKQWDIRGDEKLQWDYNCLDCVRQFEVGTRLRELIVLFKQEPQWAEQMEIGELAIQSMYDGVLINRSHRAQLALDLGLAEDEIGRWLATVIPQDWLPDKFKTPWYRSATQTNLLFGDILGLAVPRHRKTKKPTMGKDGIEVLQRKHPEFIRLFKALEMYRSIGVFYRNFCKAKLDNDNRMRCSWGLTETFRWTSSKNAFARGTNFQNIPEGEEE